MEVDRSLNLISKEEITDFCCRNFIRNNNEKLEVISFEYTSLGGTPKGFLGSHRFLNVLVNRKINSEETQDKIKFFVKSIPDIAAQIEYCEGFGVFKKETNVYKYLLPRIFDINIGNDNYFAPKCYLVKNEILIFENLTEQGFRIAAKNDGLLDYDHLLCVLNTLAIMHSSSIILEYRTKKTISEMYGNCIEENAYPCDKNNLRTILFNKAVSALCELLKSIPKYQNYSNINHLIDQFEKILRKIFEFCKPSKKFRNVLNHGDLWANNIMFKYDNNKGKNIPIDCRLVDFQLVRYAPPILDVIVVLSITSTSDFRKKYLDKLLQEYYKFLTKYLGDHDINIKDIITENEYKNSIEYYKLAGIIESCLFSHLTILPESFVSNLLQNSENFNEFLQENRNQVCLKAFNNDETYRERMTDMISDIVDNYILNENEENLLINFSCILLTIFTFVSAQIQHIAVIENDAFEEMLPTELRNPFYKTPRVREALAKSSWFGPGEQPVFERQSEKIPRSEIYSVLSHAGLIPRRNSLQ